MNEKVARQEQLLTEITERLSEFINLNQETKAGGFLFLASLHKHAFEEQGVEDHLNCISTNSHCGGADEVRGNLCGYMDEVEGAFEIISDSVGRFLFYKMRGGK